MQIDLWKALDDGAIELNVHAQPGAGRTHVAGRHGGALKVRVAAPPEQGKANDALVRALAEAFGTEEGDVDLVSGASSRTKRFRISGVERSVFAERLDELVEEGRVEPGPKGRRSAGPSSGPLRRR